VASGNSQRTNGSINRDERFDEPVSADAPKITNIHRMTGNQYFRKLLARDTPLNLESQV
jgi:hypothetical protein